MAPRATSSATSWSPPRTSLHAMPNSKRLASFEAVDGAAPRRCSRSAQVREDRCAWAVAPLPVFDQNPGGQLPVALVGQEVVLEQSVMGRILLFAECHRLAPRASN